MGEGALRSAGRKARKKRRPSCSGGRKQSCGAGLHQRSCSCPAAAHAASSPAKQSRHLPQRPPSRAAPAPLREGSKKQAAITGEQLLSTVLCSPPDLSQELLHEWEIHEIASGIKAAGPRPCHRQGTAAGRAAPHSDCALPGSRLQGRVRAGGGHPRSNQSTPSHPTCIRTARGTGVPSPLCQPGSVLGSWLCCWCSAGAQRCKARVSCQ